MDPSQTDYPPMKDLTIQNITENVNLINSGCRNPRLKFLMEVLVRYLHNYAREVRLNLAEWEAGIEFLTRTGQKCTDLRQEFILLSDILGLSLLVDAIGHPKHQGATEGTVLGPFHSHDAEFKQNGDDIASDPDGTPLLVVCTIKDRLGHAIEGAVVDVWETDSHGLYDVQYSARDGPHGRGIIKSNADGMFAFKGIVPVSYPVPTDGPVGDLLKLMLRHPYRPAHIHFMIKKPGYDLFISALTLRGDPYEFHDPVFGVKESLVVDLSDVKDKAMASKYQVAVGMKLLQYDFVLESEEEAAELRKAEARHVMETEGRKIQFWNNLPVPIVD